MPRGPLSSLLRLACAWPLLAFACLAPPASAHPVHTSSAEANYNRTTRKLEVSLRVFADDFEAALAALAGEAVSLEKTPPATVDALARAYLTAHFIVKNRDGVLAAQHWLGRELKDAANELWLHFEIDLPGGVDGVRVDYAVLKDLHSDQLNTVRVRDGPRTRILTFPPGQGERTVRFPP